MADKKEMPLPSPCVSVCVLNDEDVCEGCWRSVQEITRWGAMDNDERREVLAQLYGRAKAAGAVL